MKQITALVVLLLVAGGLVFYSQWRPRREIVSGFIEAHDIRVGSRVGGRIARVLKEEGDPIVTDDELVVLDPFDFNARLSEAQATLVARKAERDRLVRGFRVEEKAEAKARRDQLAAHLKMLEAGPRAREIQAARGQLAIAQFQLQRSSNKLRRTREIVKQGQGTPEELDDAVQQESTARAQVDIREQELKLLEEGTRREQVEEAKAKLAEAEAIWQLRENGFRSEEKAEAEAAVQAAEAAVKMIQEQMAELTIKAPPVKKGVVEALDLRPGDLVAPNAPVLTLMDKSTLWVRAYVPEGHLGLARIGRVVPITIDSFPGERFQGEITFVSPQAEFTPRNVQTIEERSKQVFRIKVTLKDGLDKLLPGMIGDVHLGEGKDPKAP